MVVIVWQAVAIGNEMEERKMNFFKRALKSITRQFGKNIILLLLIFILSSIITGAILVEGAIGATEANLRRRMPSIVSVGVDEERVIEAYHLTGEFPETGMITADFVREIGDLPYVRDFNYSMTTMLLSFDLRSYLRAQPDGNVDFFDLTGVSSANLPHIEEGLIEVVGGEMLSVDEINVPNDNGIVPAFVSSSLAEVNQLQVGSVFTLSGMIVDFTQYVTWREDNLFAQEDFQFEIVGLFDIVADREAELEAASDSLARMYVSDRHMEILNQIYVPNYVIEEIAIFENNAHNELDGRGDSGDDGSPSVSSLFILEDPLYAENFRAAVEPLLPDYIGIADFSHAFDDISSSMESFQQIADWVLWLAIGATLVILTLLINLFLRDRRHEMGIYLALGEKKERIISQILIEVIVVACVGITLAVFVGNVALSGISQTMLRNELVEINNAHSEGRNIEITGQDEVTVVSFFIPNSNSLVGRGFNFEMNPEELLEDFEIAFGPNVVMLIYGIGLAVVIVSTLGSIIYIVRLNPKKVLL